MTLKTTLTVLSLGFALVGCSSTATVKAPENFPQLTVKADEPNTLVFAKQNLNLGQYGKAYIAPVAVKVSNDQGTKDVTDEEARRLGDYTRRRLQEELSKKMTLVEKPGPDVLTVRFQITDLEPTSKAQIAMMVPPFALINMLSSKGAFLGSITLAGELYEGLSTEASVAFVGTRSRPGIDASVAFGRWTVAEKIIDGAAERLAEDLSKARVDGN